MTTAATTIGRIGKERTSKRKIFPPSGQSRSSDILGISVMESYENYVNSMHLDPKRWGNNMMYIYIYETVVNNTHG